MSAPAVTVDEFCGVKEVAAILAIQGFNGVPVLTRTGRLIGIITEDDLILRQDPKVLAAPHFWSDPHHTDRIRAHGRLAREIMTPNPVTISASAGTQEAAELMHERHLKCLPVVDEEGELMGMLARRDLVRQYMRPDADIQSELEQRMRDRGYDLRSVEPVVRDGVATFTGSVDRASDASWLTRIAEDTDGVAGIRMWVSAQELLGPPESRIPIPPIDNR